jgi:Tol biopolymer transport system component
MSPAWSQDGRFVAYLGVRVPGPFADELVVADALSKRELRRLGPARPLSWSPDSTHYAFVSLPASVPSPAAGVAPPAPQVIPPDGTVFLIVGSMAPGETDVRIPVLSFSQFAWSPDGKRLAYTSRKDPQAPSDIFVLDLADPAHPRFVTSGEGPGWLDNRTLIFSR